MKSVWAGLVPVDGSGVCIIMMVKTLTYLEGTNIGEKLKRADAVLVKISYCKKRGEEFSLIKET